MKLIKLFLFLLSLIALFMASSCNTPSTDIHTKVSRKGAIEKTIRFKNVHNSKIASVNVVRLIHSWTNVDFAVDSTNSDYMLYKRFRNVSEMQASFSAASDSTIEIIANFEKEIKWFYFQYSYSEIYKTHPFFVGLPIDSFINPKYIAILHNPDSTKALKDSIENRVKKGFDILFKKAVCRMMQKSFSRFNDTILLKKVAPLACLKLSNCIGSFNFEDARQLSNQIDTFLLNQCNGFAVTGLKPFLQSEIPQWNKAVALYQTVSFQEIKNTIELPGDVIESNATQKSWNNQTWTLSFYDHLSDYQMRIKTQELNIGLLMATIIISLIFISLLVWRIVFYKPNLKG